MRTALRGLLFWFLAAAPAWAEPKLEMTSNVVWEMAPHWFGGISGAEISDNGQRISVISDSNYLLVARMLREDGRLVAMQFVSSDEFRDAKGAVLQAPQRDSEGLAISPTGEIFVSFEDQHRVARIDPKTWLATRLPTHPDFPAFEENSGMEALAIDADGALYTLPETSVLKRGPFPLYVFRDNRWQRAATVARRGPFLPVGADFGPQGRMYLLERAATPLGFRSRIRRLTLTGDEIAEETLLTTLPGRFDNLEAISVWQDAGGQTFVTVISDDNYLAIQQTQIVEFALVE